MTALTKIRLYGQLAEVVGHNEIKLGVQCPRDIFAALWAMFPKTRSITTSGNWKVWKTKGAGIHRQSVVSETMRFPLGDCDTVHIIPEGQQAGIETVLLVGAVVLSGVAVAASLFLPIPTGVDSNELENDDGISSGVISRPKQRVAEGHPASLIYGDVFTRIHVVSSQVEIADTTSSIWGDTDSDDGGYDEDRNVYWTSGWSTPNYNKSSGKGGGGGGSFSEAADTLVSNSLAKVLGLVGVGKQVGLVNGLQDVYVNDTPVLDADGNENLPGFAIEVRTGDEDQDHISGFDSSSASISDGREISVSGGALIHTITESLVDSANVVIGIPALSLLNADDNSLEGSTVSLQIEVQADGGGYISVVSPAKFSGKNTSPYQRSYKVDLPEGGAPWDIRVTRLTADSSTTTLQNSTYLDFITETVDQKFYWPGIAFVGITVNTSLMGSGDPDIKLKWRGRVMPVPDNFDPVARTYDGIWDGVTFKEAYCDDPAWAAHDIASNDFFGAGAYLGDKIDVWAYYAASVYNSQTVPDGNGGTEFRHTISMEISERVQALTLLRRIAATFRSHAFWGSNGLSLFQERPALDADKILLVPANMSKKGIVYDTLATDGQFSAVTVWFNDIDNFYEPKSTTTRDADLIRKIGFEVKSATAAGAATIGEASRVGGWLMEEQNNLGKFASMEGGRQLSRVTPGVVVKIHDDRKTLNSMGGRIANVSGTVMTLDRNVVIEIGRTYTVDVMLPDGSLATKSVTTDPGTTNVIEIDTAYDLAPNSNAPWALESDVLALQEFRVLKVDDIKGGKRLRLRKYDETSWDRVEQGVKLIPVSTSNLISGAMPFVDPTTILIKEFQEIDGDSSVPSVLVSWSAVNDPRAIRYETQISIDDGGYKIATGSDLLSCEVHAVTPGTMLVRVRPIGSLGMVGAWSESEFTLIAGTGTMPPVTNLAVNSDNEALQTWLLWDAPTDFRPYKYEIYKGPEGNVQAAELIGQSSRREQIITEAGEYFVRTSYMTTKSVSVAITVTQDDLAKPLWERTEGRPQSLSDLDNASALAIAANAQGVTDLVTVYGDTASSAQNAATALTAQSATLIAKDTVLSAQSIAESARDEASGFAGDAESSSVAADLSRAASEVSETNAATSAQSATTSEAAAAQSASLSAASQTAAGDSATAAANSATTSITKANEAGVSADLAATEALTATAAKEDAEVAVTASSASASSAAASETSSGQYASAAQVASDSASTSAGQSSVSAGQAAVSETKPDGSASAAAVSEGVAAAAGVEAQNQASASAASALNSSASETAAGLFAAASETSSLSAAAENAQAGVSSSTAVAAASSAEDSASSAEEIKNITARISSGAINENSTFSDYPDATGIPTNWTDWGNATTGVRAVGKLSENAFELESFATENSGLRYDSVRGNQDVTAGHYVLEADFTLVAGVLDGAGVWLLTRDPTVLLQNISCKFVTDTSNNTGVALGNGVVGERYTFSKLIELTGSDIDKYTLFIIQNGALFGTLSDKTLRWHKCAIRAATQMEIEAGKVSGIEATVTTHSNAIASNSVLLATQSITVAANEALATTNQTAVSDLGSQLGQAEFSVAASVGDSNEARMTLGAYRSADGTQFNTVLFETDALGFKAANGLGFTATGEGIFKDIPTIDISPDGNWMKVNGAGFGVSLDLLEWYGPNLGSPSNCTRQNGNEVKTADGQVWQFGVQLGVSAISTTAAIASTGTVTDTGIGSNGNLKTVSSTTTVSAGRAYTVAGNGNATPGTTTYSDGSASTTGQYRVSGGSWLNVSGSGASVSTGTVTKTVLPYDQELGYYVVDETFSASAGESEGFSSNAASTYEARAIGSVVVPTGFSGTVVSTRISTSEPA